jgi:SAM-dependent methyltransferase
MLRWLFERLRPFLRVASVRALVARVRFWYLVKVRKRLRTLDGQPDVSANTVMHNLRSLGDLAVNRSLRLIRPLSVIETVGPGSRVLTIGPRTEGEILNLLAYDFRPGNIRGLDLISYSPWIDLGDMHAMPYADQSFDVVILGWVLGYSDNPRQAAKEVLRVLRPGGIVAVGLEYNPKTQDEIASEQGYLCGARRRIESTQEVLNFFGGSVDQVYFRHDVAESRRGEIGSLIVIFSVTKDAVRPPRDEASRNGAAASLQPSLV